jgi:membrane protease YdiL (CAAX protease family)
MTQVGKEPAMSNSIKSHPLISYYVLACFITWFFQGVAVLLGQRIGMVFSNELITGYWVGIARGELTTQQILYMLLFLLGAGPLLSAMMVTAVVGGRDWLQVWWGRVVKWRVGLKWYLAALGLPVLASVVAILVGMVLMGNRLVDYKPLLPLSLLPVQWLSVTIFTGLWEEPGWRGFILPRLQAKYSAWNATWVLGGLNALWHFPIMLYLWRDQSLPVVLVLLAAFTMGLIGQAITWTWFYNSTRSTLIAILFHGMGNTAYTYLYGAFQNITIIYVLVFWILAIILFLKYGTENLAAQPKFMVIDPP